MAPAAATNGVAPSPGQTVIGINFGQSYSSIAVINKEGLADCIANEDGERQMATAVSFAGGQEYFGVPARHQLVRNAPNTIVGFRNLLGKSGDEASGQKGIYGSASPVPNGSEAAYKVKIDEKEATLTVTEVAVKYVQSLLGSAEDYLGRKIDVAVVAVPPSFTSQQVQAIEKVLQQAGVKPLQVIHEAAAAAVAYGLVERSPIHPAPGSTGLPDSNVVALDVGASSTTVNVVAVRDGLYTPLSSVRDDKLGGDDFDARLIDHFAKEFTKKTKVALDPSNARAFMKLRLACEVTKRSLSASTSASCSVESLAEGMDFHTNLNRTRFDMLLSREYGKIVDKVLEAVKKAGLDVLDIQQVLLVGGSTRLPSLVERLRDAFSDKTSINLQIDPDEVVAKGCALQAQSLVQAAGEEVVSRTDKKDLIENPHLAKPIGLVLPAQKGDKRAVDGKLFITLLEANSPLPVRRIVELEGPKGASEVLLSLWEGSHEVLVEKPDKVVANGNAKKGGDDADDEDEDEEEEEEEIRTAFVKPTAALIDIKAPFSASKVKPKSKETSRIKIAVTVDRELKGTIEARQNVDGVEAVKASFGGSS